MGERFLSIPAVRWVQFWGKCPRPSLPPQVYLHSANHTVAAFLMRRRPAGPGTRGKHGAGLVRTPVRSACDPAQSKACIPAVWPVSQLGSWSSPPERPVHAFQPAAVSTIEVQRWKGLSPSAWCKHAECACVRARVLACVCGGTAAPSLQEGQPSQDSPCCRPHGVLQSGPALTQHVSSQILLILPY